MKKTGKSFDFPAVVDYTSNLSNFFEDLKKLDAFAKSVEYLLVNDNKEKENH